MVYLKYVSVKQVVVSFAVDARVAKIYRHRVCVCMINRQPRAWYWYGTTNIVLVMYQYYGCNIPITVPQR